MEIMRWQVVAEQDLKFEREEEKASKRKSTSWWSRKLKR
jgi:hypothetical protein